MYVVVTSFYGVIFGLQDGASHKRQPSSGGTSSTLSPGEKSMKHGDQPKPKRRRVANKDDLIDS